VGVCKKCPESVSVRYSVSNHASQECVLEFSNFGVCTTLLFRRSSVINCLKRKYSAFMSMLSLCPGVMIHMSMCITDLLEMITIQVISSGRDWCIRLYFFIGIKVVVCLPSKNFGGNDATSCVFLNLILV
jgi:hypothetical protein